MLSEIISWSSRNRFLVICLAMAITVFGIYISSQTNVDVLPEFAPPQVIILTEAPGMVAQEVETLVTTPLETALNGTSGVTLVKSVSQTGISQITVIFQYGQDIYTARQLVSEKIQLVSPSMPHNVRAPTMLPVMSVVGDVLKIGLIANTTPPTEVRSLADWEIRNRILSIPGVARVLVMGGEQKQFQVLVNPDKLRSYNVTLDDVRKAVEASNVIAPGGYLVTPDKQFPIYGIARIKNIDELANSIIVQRNGIPVLLKHVARVQIGPAFKIGDAAINGNPGIEIIVSKQPWVSTLDITRRVEAALKGLQSSLPSDVKFVYVFRQANFIQDSIGNVISAIVLGGIFVLVILFLFLANWRTALISLAAIPLSLLSAILLVKSAGGSINTMTLGGLAIAVGEVVDDAIVDVENVYRRLKENKESANPQPAIKVIIKACNEVRSSVVYATFIVALVFLPVFCLAGIEGRIFSPLGFAYITATMSSLFIALTLTPALCVFLLGSDKNINKQEPKIVSKVKTFYADILDKVLLHPKAVINSVLVLFVFSLSLFPFMGHAFLPKFHEENLIISTIGLPGQSLEATMRMGLALAKKLLEHNEIAAIGQRAGRAELDDDVGGANFSEFDLQLKPDAHNINEIVDHIRNHLSELPGLNYDIGSFIQHRMDDVLSGGTRAPIAIKVFGPNLETLRNISTEIVKTLKSVEGTVDVRSESQVLIPQITISIDRQRAARYGLTAQDLSQNIETAFSGAIVSQVLEGHRLFSLKVWLDESARHNVDLIKSTLMDTSSGMLIPLSQVADINIVESPNAVIHENVTRRIVIQANTSGKDLVSIVNDAKAKIEKNISLPPNYYIVYAGEYAAQKEASRKLIFVSIFVLFGILILLKQGLKSNKSTILIAVNLPLATIGGIIAVAITGNIITIGSLIGFISLFGISTRNSLLLVTHINALFEEGLPYAQAIRQGALDRVIPVIMTASTAALGMLPLAVLGGAGRELEQPLAIVIIGGLISSTLLTLIIIPTLFSIFTPSLRSNKGN